MSFVQSTHFVNETDELVQIEMMLSNPSSTNVVVQVTSSDIQATGKLCRSNQYFRFCIQYYYSNAYYKPSTSIFIRLLKFYVPLKSLLIVGHYTID